MRSGCRDEPILSISLSERPPAASRATQGVLFVVSRRGLRCAFEIDEPVGLAKVTTVGAAPASAPWRRSATLEDGRAVQLIEATLLLEEIAGLGAR